MKKIGVLIAEVGESYLEPLNIESHKDVKNAFESIKNVISVSYEEQVPCSITFVPGVVNVKPKKRKKPSVKVATKKRKANK